MSNTWHISVLYRHPMYEIFANAAVYFNSFSYWPTLEDLNYFCPNKKICFVKQGETPSDFENQYEPRIFLKGEVQTRLQNWHDFFNCLIWSTFPSIKSQLNSEQYYLLRNRHGLAKQRSNYENALTIFDENGVIVVSSSDKLLTLIKNFKWKELFWVNRQELQQQLKIFVFGHSLHEKGLNPYIGMTGHAILIQESSEFFSANLANQLTSIDLKIARIFKQKLLTSPQDFYPVPILGMPDWHDDNKEESFYDNTRYFRSKRIQKTQ